MLCPTTYGDGGTEGPSYPSTLKDRGRAEEGSAPYIHDSPPKNTRSVVQNLAADTREKSLAGQKVHDQVGIIIFDEEELESESSRSDTELVASKDDYELVDRKRVKVGRITMTPLKKPQPDPP